LGRLTFTIVHVGKLKDPHIRAGTERYRRQILAYASLELCALRQESLHKKAVINSIHKKEAGRIDRVISSSKTVIALDVCGRSFTSLQFAEYLATLAAEGRSEITFLIGGPLGLSPDLVRKAHLALSLSPMTFPHELTILALMEQLYRALAYMHNHPYPK